MKKYIILSLTVVLILGLSVTVLAQQDGSILDDMGDTDSDEIIDDVDSVIQTIIYKVLPLIGVLLMAIAGVMLATGSNQGKERLVNAILGVGVIALAPAIVSWLINVFGNGSSF